MPATFGPISKFSTSILKIGEGLGKGDHVTTAPSPGNSFPEIWGCEGRQRSLMHVIIVEALGSSTTASQSRTCWLVTRLFNVLLCKSLFFLSVNLVTVSLHCSNYIARRHQIHTSCINKDEWVWLRMTGRNKRFDFVSKATQKLFWFSVENNIDVWYITTYMMFSMENMQARRLCL